MPDTITEGPWIDLLRQMGARGLSERYKVSGQSLHCVCLLHGPTEAKITMTVAVPMLGGMTVGRPVTVYAIQVWCWPSCGYRLAWLT